MSANQTPVRPVSVKAGVKAGVGSCVLLALLLAACQGPGVPPLPTQPPAEVLAKATELYAVNCQACHGGREGKTTGMALRHNDQGDVWRMSDAQIREVIMNGRIGKGMMPTFKLRLSQDEVGAIVALMKTWWTDDQRRSQAETTRRDLEAGGGTQGQ